MKWGPWRAAVPTKSHADYDPSIGVVTLSQQAYDSKHGDAEYDEAGHHDDVFDLGRAVFGNEETFDTVGKIHDSTS
jgi:hypothetical protein